MLQKVKMLYKKHTGLFLVLTVVALILATELIMLYTYAKPPSFLAICFDVGFLLIIYLGINLLPNNIWKRVILMIPTLILLLLFIGDTIYVSYYGFFATVSSLRSVGNVMPTANRGDFVIQRIGDFGFRLHTASFVQLTLSVIAIWLICVARLKKKEKEEKITHTPAYKKQRFKKATVWFTVAVLILFGNIGYLVNTNRPANAYATEAEYYQSNSFLYHKNYNSIKFASTFGYLNMRVRDITLATEKLDITQQEIDAFYAAKPEKEINDLTGKFGGRNVVSVLCESFDTRMYDIFGASLLPHYADILTKSYKLENYYVPMYPSAPTINSTFMFQTGLYPVNDTYFANFANYNKDNDFTKIALAGQLQAKGYSTSFMHANVETFYDRHVLFPNMGFEKVIGRQAAYEAGIAVTEEEMNELCKDVELLKLMPLAKLSQPFYLDIATFSTHGGFEQNYIHYSDLSEVLFLQVFGYEPKSKDDRMFIDYMNKLQEFDAFLGQLVIELKDRNLYDNTMIVLYSDHKAYSLETNGSQGNYKKYLGVDFTSKEAHQQRMVILDGKTEENRTFDCFGSTIDMTPTILNLIERDTDRLSFNYTYFMGNDIFDEKGIITFVDLSIIYDHIEMNIDGSYQTLNRRNPLTAQQRALFYDKLITQIKAVEINRQILKTDYFKTI